MDSMEQLHNRLIGGSMKRLSSILLSVLYCALGLVIAAPLHAQQGLVDKYLFDLGRVRDVELSFTDRSLGDTDISFRLNCTFSKTNETYSSVTGDADVRMEVFRYTPPNTASSSLGIEKIELIFLNAAGKRIRTVVVDRLLRDGGVYTFGSSSSGFFEHSLSVKALTGVHSVLVRIWGWVD